MTISRSLLVNRAAQVKHFNNSCRAQVKVLLDNFFNQSLINFSRAETFDANRYGISHADCISKLNFAFVSKPRRHDIFRDVTSRISRAPVNLRGVFAAESSAAMTRPAAVSVHDNFSARQAAIALRSADNKFARRIHKKFRFSRQKFSGHDRFNNVLNHIAFNLVKRHVWIVLRRNDNRINCDRLTPFIGDCDLRFAVGAQVVYFVRSLSDFGKTTR